MAEFRLQIPVRAQEMTLWCWAAVASGVSAAYTHKGAEALAPCRIALRLLGHGCCSDPLPCNRRAELDQALAVVGLGSAPRTAKTVTFTEIVDWVQRRELPVGARIEDAATGGGHCVLIVGCDRAAGTLLVADPYGERGFPAPIYEMKHETLLQRYGDWGRCTHLYFIG